MFLLIPFLFLAFSIIGIAVIVFRKKSYLNKLSILNNNGASEGATPVFSWKAYGTDFFPEIIALIDRVEFNRYRTHWLIEIEKFLRKARVLSLRMDRISDVMINKIRKIHLNDKLNGHGLGQATMEEAGPATLEDWTTDISGSSKMSTTFLKNEEERLVIEIAKNPKDSSPYEKLGDLYIEMNNFIDAKESYEAAIELNPQNESLKQKLSSALGKITSQN